MSEIAKLLTETEGRLYDFGIMDEQFIQGVKLLCELGFEIEVQCIIGEYENFIFHNA